MDNYHNQYSLDLKEGKVIKNGSSISRVPEEFKKSQYYQMIFDNRNFEVYPNETKTALRARRDFKEMLKGNINPQGEESAFFEF